MLRKGLVFACFGLACLGTAASAVSAQTSVAPALQYRFLGETQLGADTNAATLSRLWSLPATKTVKDQAIARLSYVPQFLFQQAFERTADLHAEVQPLLEDLATEESCGEARVDGSRGWSWVLAVRVTHQRASVWGGTYMAALQRLNFGTITNRQTAGVYGWEIPQAQGAAVFRYVRIGSWCLAGMGTDGLGRFDEVAAEVKANGRPALSEGEGWFAARVDLSRLAPFARLGEYVPFLPADGPEFIDLQVGSQADTVRTKATLHYGAPLPGAFEPWRVPTNSIRDFKLISFTAVQGIAPWLTRQPYLRQLGLESFPNQAFSWAFPYIPYQTYCALPVEKADRVLDRIAHSLIPSVSTNLTRQSLGELAYVTNSLHWVGLPAYPSLRSFSEPGGEYLLLSLFSLPAATNPPPMELFAQVLGRTNLYYYDWEITQERLLQLRILSQVIDMVRQSSTGLPELERHQGPGFKWLRTIADSLGNTVTEATLTGARDITLKRKSDLGLTGLELVALTRWLDGPDFPWPGLRSENAPHPK